LIVKRKLKRFISGIYYDAAVTQFKQKYKVFMVI